MHGGGDEDVMETLLEEPETVLFEDVQPTEAPVGPRRLKPVDLPGGGWESTAPQETAETERPPPSREEAGGPSGGQGAGRIWDRLKERWTGIE